MIGLFYINFKSSLCSHYFYGFNGKEKDDEGLGGGGSTYDYGFRIYNAQLGKFLSVDPLYAHYAHYTPYQFAGNIPIAAIDIDGLEQKIIIKYLNEDGKTTCMKLKEYSTVSEYGPLGNGTYTAYMKPDGTFSEKFEPGENNSVEPFNADGISQSEFYNENGGNFKGLEKRLNGRLIESVIENELIEKGFNEKDVRDDVSVLEGAPDIFTGKFASFKEGTEDKYTKGWTNDGKPSDNHKSKTSKASTTMQGTEIKMKFYDGEQSKTDNIPAHVGLVQNSFLGHIGEAISAKLDSEVNIGAENAKTVKAKLDDKAKKKAEKKKAKENNNNNNKSNQG